MILQDIVIQSARRFPEAIAVKDAETVTTYKDLDRLANCFAHALKASGVQRGDRVGLWMEKSARTIAAMQGVLRLGAIYVPLDSLSPVARIYTIVQDCAIQVVITTPQRALWLKTHGPTEAVRCLCVQEQDLPGFSDEPVNTVMREEDIAYILYTSGSTGTPKGVCISHQNALAFVEWAVRTLQATPHDRFANHAPFHFDLSVLDLYAAFYVGATVVLVPESQAYLPDYLVHFLVHEQISVWYSVPSVLIMMMEYGGLLRIPSSNLRALLFAGEVFPIKHLRRLHEHWPAIRYLNLYGPTETNVCMCYEVPGIQLEQTTPVPIGRACCGNSVWAQRADGAMVASGEVGELMVYGPTVMKGYWGKPEQGNNPYPTGDRVRLQSDGNYVYVGRCDHQVKIRGYRVEPGDVESALLEHPELQEVVVLAIGEGIEAKLTAFAVCRQQEPPTLLDIKKHCAERLPRYMIVDAIQFLPALPRTRNGKVNRMALEQSVVLREGIRL